MRMQSRKREHIYGTEYMDMEEFSYTFDNIKFKT